MQKIILNWIIINIPLWAHNMNFRVISVSLIKNIFNQGLQSTFWRKIIMTVFSYGNNQKDHLFRHASQVFRIAAHPLHPHANSSEAMNIVMKLPTACLYKAMAFTPFFSSPNFTGWPRYTTTYGACSVFLNFLEREGTKFVPLVISKLLNQVWEFCNFLWYSIIWEITRAINLILIIFLFRTFFSKIIWKNQTHPVRSCITWPPSELPQHAVWLCDVKRSHIFKLVGLLIHHLMERATFFSNISIYMTLNEKLKGIKFIPLGISCELVYSKNVKNKN